MKFYDKNIIKTIIMYLICWCDEKEEKHDIAEEYQQHKIKPRPKIHISEFKENEIKASRNWIGLNLDGVATIIIVRCSHNTPNPPRPPSPPNPPTFLPLEIVEQSFCTI